ncbi:MAG: hypothetical protein ETSY1_26510 [Candidatus Entotheonella factor]|uniref:LysM domain-containing protein n=1 Tax=Entotheonella factor TaxID=1429438 RepID=W4LED6_ENTF1|nr:MAG: hypothetical protein ETSY1_26510 [Candidatus Entotheonella factor]
MKRLHIPILSLSIVLFAGLLILRPEVTSAASHQSDITRYIVREGDSLSKIARQFYQDSRKWKIIFDANSELIKTPEVLQVGWSLRIPSLDDSPQPQPAQPVKAGPDQAAPPPKRTLVTRNLYPPFVHQSLPNQGMLTDIIQTAFETMNYKIEILFRPLGDGLSATREGRVTGTFPHAQESGSKDSFFASQPLYRVLIRGFVRVGNPLSFDTLNDLQGLVLCQPEGTSTSALQPLVTSNLITLDQSKSIDACFEALVNQKVDMVVVDEFGGRHALDRLGMVQQVCMLNQAVAIETLHLLFSKIAPQSRVVVYEFDQALRRLTADGTLKSITTRHLQSYYQTLPNALQECQTQPSQAPPAASLDTAPSAPSQTVQENAEKPAEAPALPPVRPSLTEQPTAELTRIVPLSTPNRQEGEFLTFAPPQRAPKQLELISLAVTEQPKIDGYAEEPIWQLAPAVTTLDASSQRQITLKSVHTADEIFFLVSFPDQAASETHQSWGWDDSVEAYKPMGDREDTFVFKWSMVGNQANLAFQNAEPHRADIWHWKALRTNPLGYADDKMHLLLPESHEQATVVESPIHGSLFLRRLADAGQGAYREYPVTTYKADYLPRFYPYQPEGSRADVRAKGVWHNNAWTLEFSRKMYTGNADDIKFDPGESYLFAVSCYEMGYGKLEPNLTQPLYYSGDAFDRLLLKVARGEEG